MSEERCEICGGELRDGGEKLRAAVERTYAPELKPEVDRVLVCRRDRFHLRVDARVTVPAVEQIAVELKWEEPEK